MARHPGTARNTAPQRRLSAVGPPAQTPAGDSLVDNHIHAGNARGIDSRKILWRRVIDLNDRSLRRVIIGLGGALWPCFVCRRIVTICGFALAG
ncbi:MAG: formate--tetrahydrofolate ligase [Vicinamibacteria bacterium]|nr:formate--tetrahydrofolate ligase [Vicinamibacteria bacterium]